MDGQGESWSLFRMRPLLLGLLVVTAQAGPTPVTGDASGSDWVNACIDLDWHSKEVALSETPLETAAGGTSQACGAGRITLGVLTDVQRNIYDRGCPGGPHKTSSAFYGCRGSDCGGGCMWLAVAAATAVAAFLFGGGGLVFGSSLRAAFVVVFVMRLLVVLVR